MPQRPIQEVALNEAGHLHVRPQLVAGEDYSHIYRDASGITWIAGAKALGAREPHRWQPLELFKQILAAVQNEYGHNLVVSAQTQWTNVPADLQAQIRELPQKDDHVA